MEESAKGPQRWLYAAFTLALLGFYLYSVRSVLTPFVLLPAVVLAATPWAGTREHLIFVVVCSVVGLLWAVETAGFLLAPFILALVIAYILNPLVSLVQRRRVPRGLAILFVAAPGLVVVVLALVFGLPALGDELTRLAGELPQAISRLAQWIESNRNHLANMEVPLLPSGFLQHWANTYDPARLAALLESQQQQIIQHAWSAVLGIGRGVGAVITILSYLILTPILSFYLLRDWGRLQARLKELIPAGAEHVLDFAHEYDRLLSHYFRGQLLEATFVGTATGVGLLVLGFPYAGVVGAVAGLFNFVPYVGLLVSLVPAIVISLLSGAVLASLGKVAIVFATVQLIDGSVTGPRIVGGSVGLNPVWIMLALALGSFFFGFVGLLLAVPGAVLVKLLLSEGVRRYERSSLYRGSGGDEAASAPPQAAGDAAP